MSENLFIKAVRDRPGRPLVVAHRGDSAHEPENTKGAARRGWEVGADAWELDVQLSRDGVAVVVHDPTLGRTTDVARRFAGDARGADGFRVADFDLGEIESLDAGSWFVEPSGGHRSAARFGTLGGLTAGAVGRFASGSVRVPTLRACLELTGDLGWLVNVELKFTTGDDPRLLDAVAAEVSRLGMAGRVLVSSFDHRAVARAAGLGLGWATGVLNVGPLYRPKDYVRGLVGADFYHISREGFDTAAADPGGGGGPLPVLVYTVNDAAPGGEAWRLGEAGAAGLFADDPSAVLGRFGGGVRRPG